MAVETEDRYRPVTAWKTPGPLSFAARSVEDLERELGILGVTVDLDDAAEVEWRGGGKDHW